MSTSSRSSVRSAISPFRSRKSTPPPSASAPKPRTATPSSASASSLSSKPHRFKPPVSPSLGSAGSAPGFDRPDSGQTKENVTVTVRFRPLSRREIGKGDEIAWFADGEYTVRNECNSSIAYGFDRVFGPATTTRHVYDVAAQHVVSGAMDGINGTVFAYGVTSSGKTHTMHGEQKSPGIIPLAVKDVFGIIQETPGREFLLRVSYLEIYNEVINDLLDPTGQNLRIREDAQGTYVEGIKEEVVLSPAHALSLIASGEAHRHVGSNNFNLLSSRSHTLFTLVMFFNAMHAGVKIATTIESSSRGENQGEEVTLSQLHLIDLAGSESSKTETTGLRRKEGSYINKSLLTLGTYKLMFWLTVCIQSQVISKLTDGKATHVPYRDSKLTRLLQSSLSGHGRVSLICTVTPASSNTEETHNTLKFAHRSKHVEIKASQNKILDEKSLIKKYQKEISTLKQELEQLKRGMMDNSYMMAPNQEDLVNLRLQLEAGQVKLQSRLEEEEQAKAALMGRIQRLTKLILVSTKNTLPSSIMEKPSHRRRHSFAEDELAYLPDRKREYMIDDDTASIGSEFSADGRSDINNLDELVKDYKRNSRRGMLGWFKLKRPENLVGLSPCTDCESSTSGSPTSSTKSFQKRVMFSDVKDGRRKSTSKRGDDPSVETLQERTQAGDLFSATVGGRCPPPSGTTITDQMDLLREQVKMLAGEVALCTSSLKRLSEQAASNPGDSEIQEHMQQLKGEIREKKLQIRILEQRMIGSVEMSQHTSNSIEMSQALSKLATQLNQKTFELEIKSADNRILQEQLQLKVSETADMQEKILQLRRQLDSLLSNNKCSRVPQLDTDDEVSRLQPCSEFSEMENERKDGILPYEETLVDENTPTSVMSLNRVFNQEDLKEYDSDALLNSQLLMQATEIETLKQENVKMAEEKDGLIIQSQKLAEEGSYAKELAAAAAIELRNLAQEVTKFSYQNAKLTADLAAAKEACGSASFHTKQNGSTGPRPDTRLRKRENGICKEEMEQELNARYQREASLVAALSERDKIEGELRKILDEAKRREEDLENELSNMWVLVAKLRKSANNFEDTSLEGVHASKVLQTSITSGFSLANGHSNKIFVEDETCENMEEASTFEEIKTYYLSERRRCKELESMVSRLRGDDIAGLDITTLEELQNLHVEAITKICHAKRFICIWAYFSELSAYHSLKLAY
ncbi:hypothetical protein RJ639_008154 [Escallonia herrerae]|uniref:Kinesin motor domain-containing protein n=1 Tax=Escallonia herrerae TaxID=1293975 RepID=A0AA89ASU3_9ASTE|nr:hypothetical protein RJ639_008154 [Escallonia herrerae]